MDQIIQHPTNFDDPKLERMPYDVAKRERITPNGIAYDKSTGRIYVTAKRSIQGDDYALGQRALEYVLKLLAHGARRDGSPVTGAYVALVDRTSNVTRIWSAEELRDQLSSVEPIAGDFGPYWWIQATGYTEDNQKWSVPEPM
jgi:hypothetical protein